MSRSGTEFLEDGLLAKQLSKEELEIHKKRTRIRQLQENLDTAWALFLDAEDRRFPEHNQDLLEQGLALARAQFDAETLAQAKPSVSSVAMIQSALNRASLVDEAKGPVPSSGLRAQAIRSFTPAELEKINAHYLALPEQLRNLMDAAIGDERIMLDLARNPVFIRGEGQIYDRKTVEDLLKEKEEALCPYNHGLLFRREDIIPCNTLLKALELLLHIIDGEASAPKVEDKLSSLFKIGLRKRVSEREIAFIEKHYTSLSDRHKLLFDAICRDPKTKEIMDDPVFLPDGYVYDRSTAMAYLKIMKGTCPMDSEITFSEKDITPCQFVVSVLDCLKQNIEEKLRQAQQLAAAQIVDSAPSLQNGL